MFARLAAWFDNLRAQRDTAQEALRRAAEQEHGHAHDHADGTAHTHDHAHGDHDHDHA